VKDPSSRLLKWRLKLEEYDYEVAYKIGSENRNADALSRIHVTTPVSKDEDNKPRWSQEDKTRILREMHENPTGGHLGMNRTHERIKLFVTWSGMKQEIEDYVRRCEICQKNKINKIRPKCSCRSRPRQM
jgi:hypothetical protein